MVKDPKAKWHKWFAWYMVDVDLDKKCWLAYVWRRAHPASYDGYGGNIWEYLPIGKDPEIEEIKNLIHSSTDGYQYRIGYSRTSDKVIVFNIILVIVFNIILIVLLLLIIGVPFIQLFSCGLALQSLRGE